MRTALIYNFLIEANIMASIAIVLMMVLRRFLRKPLGNSALCFGWLLVALRLLLPLSLPNPLMALIRSPYAQDAAIRPIAGQVKVRLTDALNGLSSLLGEQKHFAASNAVWDLADGITTAGTSMTLIHIYFLGVAAVLAWFLAANVRFRLYLRSGRIEPISGKLLEQYQQMCESRQVRPVPVYFTDPLPSACLVGIFKPYIALPLTAKPQEAIQVLTHEVCHLKNLDPVWNILRLLCCAVHWFNPLVWLAASMSRTDTELRCDDRVTRPMALEERQAYANVLLLAASRRNAPGIGVLATGMTMTGKRLKTRILTVLQGGRHLKLLSVSFMVLTSMCLLGAFATAELRPAPRLAAVTADIRRAIQSDEDAIAYARQVWGQQVYGVSGLEDLEWRMGPGSTDGDILRVNAGPQDGETSLYTVTFDRQGNLRGLHNETTDPDNIWGADRFTLSQEEQQDLEDALKAFIQAANPAVAEKINYTYYYAESWLENQRYVYFSFWQNDRKSANNQGHIGDIIVQISPTVRIVHFALGTGDSAGGNG